MPNERKNTTRAFPINCESCAISLLEEILANINSNLTLVPNSRISLNFYYIAELSMKPQNTSNITNSIGDINNSSVAFSSGTGNACQFFNPTESSELLAELRLALQNGRNELTNLAISASAKRRVAASLEGVAAELDQPQPDKNRLTELLGAIKEFAAPFASALSIAASLSKLIDS